MNINTFDLNLLRAFDALMSERNVSAAGARIGLSQPAMSHALSRMRNLCDDPLFVRTSQGMQPTPYAEDLAQPVRSALALLAAALEQSNKFDPATSDRKFKLVLTDIGQSVFLPPLIQEINARAPNVRVSVLQLAHDALAGAMESGAADLAIGGIPTPSDGYFQQRLVVDRYVCVMRRGHPLAGRTLTVDDYVQAAHAVPAPTWYNANTRIDRALAEARLVRRVQLEFPHFLVLPMVLRGTDLIATVARTLSDTLMSRDEFVTSELPFEVSPIEIRQFWHPRFHQDAGIRWLRNFFANHFAGGIPEGAAEMPIDGI
jgi:DNA-binding transcriptional LysR family regulator